MYNYSYNPYQQMNPMLQTQPVMSPQPTYGLSGRMIDDIATVGANEVNLDGTPSIFIKKDLSEVFIKKWNQNGLIDTTCYKLFIPEAPKTPKRESDFVIEDSIRGLQETLVDINEKLNRALSQTVQKQKSPTKKEVEL